MSFPAKGRIHTGSTTLAGTGRVPVAAAVAMVAGGVLLVLTQSAIRPLEAWVAAAIVGGFHVAPARSLGSAVIFPIRGSFVGFYLSEGCTAALLVSPFCLVAAGLVLTHRTTVRRGVGTLVGLTVGLFAVNQARLVIIALSMRLWGFHHGYEVSHILLGTIVSTLGVLAGLLVFVTAALAPHPVRAARG
ncbi:MAG: hypothetical protein ABR511_14825 [Acidimicrobiales bacterium]